MGSSLVVKDEVIASIGIKEEQEIKEAKEIKETKEIKDIKEIKGWSG